MATVKSERRLSSLPLKELTEERLLDRPLIRIPASAATCAGFTDWAVSRSRPQHARMRYLGQNIFIEIYPGFYAFTIPVSAVASAEGFCNWMESGPVPDWGRFSYVNREVVIDMSPEEIETHNKVKTAISATLSFLNQELDLGEFYSDGVLLADLETGISTAADATFATWKSLKSGRVKLVPRKNQPGQFVRIEGSPDWVLEILSMWSAKSDLKEMRERYHDAGISEYWIIDARGEEIIFQILVRRRAGYVAVRPVDGWNKSKVFGRSFRLTRKRHHMGFWQYKLAVKPVE